MQGKISGGLGGGRREGKSFWSVLFVVHIIASNKMGVLNF